MKAVRPWSTASRSCCLIGIGLMVLSICLLAHSPVWFWAKLALFLGATLLSIFGLFLRLNTLTHPD